MDANAGFHPGDKAPAVRRQPHAIRSPVRTRPSFDPAGRFELIEQGNDGRSVEADRLGKPALRQAGAFLDRHQDPDPARRDTEAAERLRKIAKDRQLRQAQPITEKIGQLAGGGITGAAIPGGIAGDRITSTGVSSDGITSDQIAAPCPARLFGYQTI